MCYTTNSYNSLNQLFKSESAAGGINNITNINYFYNNDGTERVETTAPDGKLFKKITDASGLLISAEDNGGLITYPYYHNGKLNETKVAGVATNTVEYDAYGRQSKLTEANSGQTLYQFDAFGRLAQQTDASNNVTVMQYDLLDRVTQKTVTPPAAAAINYTYSYINSGNGLNMLQSVSNGSPGSTYSYFYDNLNRITKVDENINSTLFSTSYEYDQFSNITKETYPSGFAINYAYNANGYHTQINRDDNGNLIYNANKMNALGQYTQYTLGNGSTTVKAYTDFGYLTSCKTPGIQWMNYSFNPINGNLNSRADVARNLSESFTYDNLDRLKTTSGTNGVTVNYSGNGNITDKSDASTALNTYTYDNVKINAVKKINNPLDISSSTQNISYTAFNKVQTITERNYDQMNFTYGPDNERKETVLMNTQSGSVAIRYFSGNYEKTLVPGKTTEVHYINAGAGLVAMYVITNGNGVMYFPYTDHLGSILDVTDQAGTYVANQSFDAWGRYRDPATWQPLPPLEAGSGVGWLYRGFTEHEYLPKFALINMNGRMYDPVVGRMLSPDNNLQEPGYSQNHNRYSYALNNPLKFTDPTGNEFDPIDDIKGFFRGVGNLLRGDNWKAKHSSVPKVKVKTEVREVTLKPATIIANIKNEAPMQESNKPNYKPEVIPVNNEKQYNFAQWNNVKQVAFKFNNINSEEDKISIKRPRLIGQNQRELFDEKQLTQTPFYKSNRFLTPLKKDVFSINFNRDLVFQPEYSNIQNVSESGQITDSNIFGDFSIQTYYNNYKIILKMKGTAKYFDALKKSKKIY